ncbi:C40 family peptidase [Bacillus sp. MUM 116]|uniref:C40 family peptidase n=1 Tax=Bacillus sp. MUM 116 TaxID=1678002 RepID=UPI002108BBC0|nr:C40 family peptidase [Bacillus sp. MUM 116]
MKVGIFMLNASIKKGSFLTAFVTAVLLLFSSMISVNAEAAQTKGQKVVSYAQKYVGSPFKYGGTNPKQFDASGYTQYVYRNAVNIKIPRTSADQYKVGKSVKLNELQPGDLVFYKTNGKSVSFVAIYIGGQKFIGATSDGVKIQSMNLSYWKEKYVGAKRVIK